MAECLYCWEFKAEKYQLFPPDRNKNKPYCVIPCYICFLQGLEGLEGLEGLDGLDGLDG